MRVVGTLLALSLVAAVAASLGAVVACSSSTVVPIQPAAGCTLQIVGLSVIASPKINPEIDGTPRPVQLRLYQLKTDTRLQNASFEQVWKDDKATLQDDLVKVDELPIYPDSRTEVKFERDPSALFVVGVALFREPKGRTWWTEFEFPPPPGKGNCMLPTAKCSGNDCPKEAGAPPLAPHYALWIDRTRIDDGADHLDEHAPNDRVAEVFLHFASSSTSSGPPGAPTAPAPPQAPGSQ